MLETTVLAGSRRLLRAHARELPQRDDLCGAFCGALALAAAGIEQRKGQPLDQDAVALAAGSVVGAAREAGTLPRGEAGRRDYRLTPPMIEDADVSGTTAAGVVSAVRELSDGGLEAIPVLGPWTSDTLSGLFDAASALTSATTLVANLATGGLWGGHPSAAQVLDYLYGGVPEGPAPDWSVGHFVCLFARTRGPAGSLYALADTYPALGNRGVHVQPQEVLAPAIERRGMAPGGVIAVVSRQDAAVARAALDRLGLAEGAWDNGTIAAAARLGPGAGASLAPESQLGRGRGR